MSATGKKTRAPAGNGMAITSARMVLPAADTESSHDTVGHRILAKRHRASNPNHFKTATLQVRVSADLKTEASRTLDALGISLPEAVRVFLGKIVREQAFPFTLEIPNAETAAGLRESMESHHERFTSVAELFHDLGKGGAG